MEGKLKRKVAIGITVDQEALNIMRIRKANVSKLLSDYLVFLANKKESKAIDDSKNFEEEILKLENELMEARNLKAEMDLVAKKEQESWSDEI